ncbi:MAG: NAD(P)-binding domain-containing protein [Bacteroidota bacterium]
MNELADIGLAGLAVMGKNLFLNTENRGFRVAANTHPSFSENLLYTNLYYTIANSLISNCFFRISCKMG